MGIRCYGSTQWKVDGGTRKRSDLLQLWRKSHYLAPYSTALSVILASIRSGSSCSCLTPRPNMTERPPTHEGDVENANERDVSSENE